MSIDEMVGLLLPIEQHFLAQAEQAENPVDAEIANHYAFTLHSIAEELTKIAIRSESSAQGDA